jgi:hypothetical protein
MNTVLSLHKILVDQKFILLFDKQSCSFPRFYSLNPELQMPRPHRLLGEASA